MRQVAAALNVPEDAIRNFNKEAVISNVSFTFSDNAVAFLFNPIDKIVDLYEQKAELYERLL